VQQDIDVWTAIADRSDPFVAGAERRTHHPCRRPNREPAPALATARAEMESIARGLAARYTFNRNTSVTVTPLREVLTGQVRTSVLVLFAGVGVLLAIACFNVASMLLARSASRPSRDRHSRVTRRGTLVHCACAAGRKPAARRGRRRAWVSCWRAEPRCTACHRSREPARRLRAVHRSARGDVRRGRVARDGRHRRPRPTILFAAARLRRVATRDSKAGHRPVCDKRSSCCRSR
jgi:hypothetical protein